MLPGERRVVSLCRMEPAGPALPGTSSSRPHQRAAQSAQHPGATALGRRQARSRADSPALVRSMLLSSPHDLVPAEGAQPCPGRSAAQWKPGEFLPGPDGAAKGEGAESRAGLRLFSAGTRSIWRPRPRSRRRSGSRTSRRT